jgi:hypothetical protein
LIAQGHCAGTPGPNLQFPHDRPARDARKPVKRAPELVPLSREHHEAQLALLPAWGAAMREHVQWEERFLFPLAESLLELPSLQRQLAAPEAA